MSRKQQQNVKLWMFETFEIIFVFFIYFRTFSMSFYVLRPLENCFFIASSRDKKQWIFFYFIFTRRLPLCVDGDDDGQEHSRYFDANHVKFKWRTSFAHSLPLNSHLSDEMQNVFCVSSFVAFAIEIKCETKQKTNSAKFRFHFVTLFERKFQKSFLWLGNW